MNRTRGRETAGPLDDVGAAHGAVVVTVSARVGRYRWAICALLFFATTINYLDRQVLGILAETLQIAEVLAGGCVVLD